MLISCSEKHEENLSDNREIVAKIDKIVSKEINKLKNEETSRLNYTDGNNLKQGRWIKKGHKNITIGIAHYKNDILNGYWFKWNAN